MPSLGLSLAGVPHMPLEFLIQFSKELSVSRAEYAPEIFSAFARDVVSG